ncbi:hypothetical protein D9758_002126 [Tetrapyrgos nigripes]|uniref:Uncharacterized protein n=1 Tax=Tetrapyrgos nigripes TaxID=182062 RepID=A0A8H5LV99_9AGAR|nr:hypothetical protein D9758_002126 [Tetrapyrgos nigripes]
MTTANLQSNDIIHSRISVNCKQFLETEDVRWVDGIAGLKVYETTADMLERLLSHNDRIPLLPLVKLFFVKYLYPAHSPSSISESLTRFHSRSAPGISILDYLKRIVKFTKVEVGGISLSELNTLEKEFLSMIDWRLTCTRELLEEYYINLVRTHSSGSFVIVGPPETSTSTEDSHNDVDMDARGTSRTPSIHEPSAIFADPSSLSIPSDVSRRPTIEQNMAFAALRDQQRQAEAGERAGASADRG